MINKIVGAKEFCSRKVLTMELKHGMSKEERKAR
jgi:hypothetical protein